MFSNYEERYRHLFLFNDVEDITRTSVRPIIESEINFLFLLSRQCLLDLFWQLYGCDRDRFCKYSEFRNLTASIKEDISGLFILSTVNHSREGNS